MQYAVKWKTTNPDRTMEFPIGYARPSEAMDCACVVLCLNPAEVWVEDEQGNRIAGRARIAAHGRGETIARLYLSDHAGSQH
jgi:hypothetical protein